MNSQQNIKICRRRFVVIFKYFDPLKMKAVGFLETSELSDTNSYPKYLNPLM